MSVQHPHDTATAKKEAIHEENVWLPGLFLNSTHAAGIFRPIPGKAQRDFHFCRRRSLESTESGH